jgi:hypothetical protein
MALIKPPFDLEAYKRNIFGYNTNEKSLFYNPFLLKENPTVKPVDAGSYDIWDYYNKGDRSVNRKDNSMVSLFDPIQRIPTITTSPLDNKQIIGKVPLSMDPNNVTGITDLSVDNESSSNNENDLVNDLVASSEKSIKEQKNYNLFKTISDAIQTGGAMIGNATAKRPEPIRPPVVIPPTYQSNLEENKNLIDRNMAGSLAAGIKMARETGRPELIPSLIANLQSGENTAYNQLAQNEIQQRNLQEVANTEAINKNAELGYGAKIQDAEMMDKINATRSELLAKMGTSLFSTIPNNYMQNKQSLVDMGNKTEIYKYLIDKGDTEGALALLTGNYQNVAQQQVAEEALKENNALNIKEETFYVDATGKQGYRLGGKWYTKGSDDKAVETPDFKPYQEVK